MPSTPAHSNAAASPTSTGASTEPVMELTTSEPSITPTPSPSASPSPMAPSTTTTPPRDRIAPKIGTATSQYQEIWTNFWCSAGPNETVVKIAVQDATDRASALKVKVQFVLHREDKGTFILGQNTVTSKSSPFSLQLGPYPGPNDKYTYSNTLDMVVTATDAAGNKSTHTFASFITFMDCKPTTT